MLVTVAAHLAKLYFLKTQYLDYILKYITAKTKVRVENIRFVTNNRKNSSSVRIDFFIKFSEI